MSLISDSEEIPLLILIGLFITALVSAQILAVKILEFQLPVSLPLLDGAIIVPAGVLAYAITFLATDCLTELYGRRIAHLVVNIGFAMIFVLLGLVWLALVAPGSPAGVDPGAFATVIGPSTNIVIGSLIAYVISQNWDVFAFHHIRTYTGGQYLWLRNIGSTATSQAIDTIVFISIAFLIAPLVFGIGDPLPATVVLSLILGQYLAKFVIAILDTPFVYLTVSISRSSGHGADPIISS